MSGDVIEKIDVLTSLTNLDFDFLETFVNE